MSDLVTTLAIALGGAAASKEILHKLLGPSAEYLGLEARELIQKGAQNLGKILRVSYEKLGKRVETPGQVNSRVLKNVWDEGRFTEDVFSAEYFGGLLASARTSDGHDDSAVPLVAMVKSLSSNQIRLHYVIYSLLARQQFRNNGRVSFHNLEMAIPGNELMAAMDFEGIEGQSQLCLALQGLVDNRLIASRYYVKLGELRKGYVAEDHDDDLVVVGPNAKGASLFLRALGSRGLSPEIITSVNVEYSLSAGIREATKLPQNERCRYRPVTNSFDNLRERYDDMLCEVEFAIDDLRDQIAEVNESLTAKAAEVIVPADAE